MARWLTVTAVWVAMLTLVLAHPWVASAATPEVRAFLGGAGVGPTTGGTGLLIFGGGFENGATVTFGDVPGIDVTFIAATQISVVSPPGAPGPVSVVVRNPGRELSIGSLIFTYTQVGSTAAATATASAGASATPSASSTQPSIASLTPSTGSSAGGTAVTINGNGFSAGSTVAFGANPATAVTVLSSTQITATTPVGALGAVAVLVTTSGGAVGGLASGFTYSLSSPVVTSVTPISGPAAGGTVVTIVGSGFLSGATVSFGGAFAPSVTVSGPTQLLATTPPGITGAVSVLIANPGGLVTGVTGGYTYTAAPSLAVTGVSPNVGPTTGGTAVTITGTGFVAGTTASFGTALATGVVVVSPTQITASTPAGTVGAVAVMAVAPGGSNASMGNAFTYQVSIAAAINLPAKGPGLFVFGGGSSDDLVRLSGCPAATAAFWASDGVGGFILYVPGTTVGAVNAAWVAKFPSGLAPSTPLVGRCS